MDAAAEQTSDTASAELSTLTRGLSPLKLSNMALTYLHQSTAPDRSSDDE